VPGHGRLGSVATDLRHRDPHEAGTAAGPSRPIRLSGPREGPRSTPRGMVLPVAEPDDGNRAR